MSNYVSKSQYCTDNVISLDEAKNSARYLSSENESVYIEPIAHEDFSKSANNSKDCLQSIEESNIVGTVREFDGTNNCRKTNYVYLQPTNGILDSNTIDFSPSIYCQEQSSKRPTSDEQVSCLNDNLL